MFGKLKILLLSYIATRRKDKHKMNDDGVVIPTVCKCHGKMIFCDCTYCIKCRKIKTTKRQVLNSTECSCECLGYYEAMNRSKSIDIRDRYVDGRLFSRVTPSGGSNSFEIHVCGRTKVDRPMLEFGVTDQAGIYTLLNMEISLFDVICIKSINFVVFLNKLRITYSNENSRYSNTFTLGINITSGDSIGLHVTNDKTKIIFIVNGEEYISLPELDRRLFENIVFYVVTPREHNTHTHFINDGCFYNDLKYKPTKMLLDLNRQNYTDVKIKTR